MKKILILAAFMFLFPLTNGAFAGHHRIHTNYGYPVYYTYHNPYMSVSIPMRHHRYYRHNRYYRPYRHRYMRPCYYHNPYYYGGSGFNINISI